MKTDFSDVRFTSSDGSTELSYWLESKTDSSTATFWVKVPSIPTTGSIIYMYYSNASVSSTANGDNTFELFDDFTGTSLNTAKWTETGVAGTVGSSMYSESPNGNSFQGIYSKNTFGIGYAYRSKGNGNVASGNYPTWGFVTTANAHQASAQYSGSGTGATGGKFADSASEFIVTGLTSTTGTNYTFDVFRDTASCVVKINDANMVTSTGITKVTADLLPAAIFGYGTSSAHNTDWVLVRKYAAIEPASVINTEEIAPVTNGVCNATNNGATLASAPASLSRCFTGIESSVTTSPSTYTWTCAGTGTGAITASCYANRSSATKIDGACGTANYTTVTSSPIQNLCLAGNPPITGNPVTTITENTTTTNHSYSWTCGGIGIGASNDVCVANKSGLRTDGVCGASHNQRLTTIPSTNLCTAGSASIITTGTSLWTWYCDGVGTGSTSAFCLATKTFPVWVEQ